MLLTELADSSVNFEVRYWTDARIGGVRMVQDRVLSDAKSALDDAGLTIPWPGARWWSTPRSPSTATAPTPPIDQPADQGRVLFGRYPVGCAPDVEGRSGRVLFGRYPVGCAPDVEGRSGRVPFGRYPVGRAPDVEGRSGRVPFGRYPVGCAPDVMGGP